MQRTEFLNELQQHLSVLSQEEIENILEEYRVYFTECEKEGKTEEQICEELGEPGECAKQYVSDIALEDAESVEYSVEDIVEEFVEEFVEDTTADADEGVAKESVKIAKKKKNKEKRKKIFWALAFIWNVIQAIISIPTTCTLFIVAGLMVIFFCFVAPLVNSIAFVCLAIFSTLSVFLLAMITLLWTIIEIQTCIKKINGEGK